MTLDDDAAIMAYVRLALREAVGGHLFDPNVNLVDFGLPEHEGVIAEDELAIRVHVNRKLPSTRLEAAGTRLVPSRIRGFRTDVLEGTYRPQPWWTGTGVPAPPRSGLRAGRVDPLRGGISISDEGHVSYGTLGGKVIDRSTGAEMILSNWHVLVADWAARPGLRTYQPGRLDGGTAAETVAKLARDAMGANLDAAVATLTGSRRLINDQLDLGPVTGVHKPRLGMSVVKSGRRTGVTHGRVTGVEGTTSMPYRRVQRIIRRVITIEPLWGRQVSASGDSGSIWADDGTMQAVGLHFAGSDAPERALAIDMQYVLAALDVELDTSRVGGPPKASLWSFATQPAAGTRLPVGAGAGV